jgi:hypothetical protein
MAADAGPWRAAPPASWTSPCSPDRDRQKRGFTGESSIGIMLQSPSVWVVTARTAEKALGAAGPSSAQASRPSPDALGRPRWESTPDIIIQLELMAPGASKSVDRAPCEPGSARYAQLQGWVGPPWLGHLPSDTGIGGSRLKEAPSETEPFKAMLKHAGHPQASGECRLLQGSCRRGRRMDCQMSAAYCLPPLKSGGPCWRKARAKKETKVWERIQVAVAWDRNAAVCLQPGEQVKRRAAPMLPNMKCGWVNAPGTLFRNKENVAVKSRS